MTPEEMVDRAEWAMRWRNAMKEAVAEAREEAIEDIAERLESGNLTGGKHPQIAAAIRALKDKS